MSEKYLRNDGIYFHLWTGEVIVKPKSLCQGIEKLVIRAVSCDRTCVGGDHKIPAIKQEIIISGFIFQRRKISNALQFVMRGRLPYSGM
jgi:hypothetical protein